MVEQEAMAPTSNTENDNPEPREERLQHKEKKPSKKLFIGGLTYGIKEEEVEVRTCLSVFCRISSQSMVLSSL